MTAQNHGDFFDEICRTLRTKARREVKDEMRGLLNRNKKLEKRLGDETTSMRNVELAAEASARVFAVREGKIAARELDINMAIKEIKFLYEQIKNVQDMPVKKLVTGSRDGWGLMSQRAKKLSAIGRSKK